MDVEAYFEEWSLLPGDRARMAISTTHAEVHATLERLTRGPRSGDAGLHSFGDPIPGLEMTIPGIQQSTALGSYCDLELAGPLAPAFGVHLWFWPTAADDSDRQWIWSVRSEEDQEPRGLAIVAGQLVLATRTSVHQLGIPVSSRIWYSLVVQVESQAAGPSVVVEVEQVSGVPVGPRRVTRRVEVEWSDAVDRLRLAGGALDDTGSLVEGFNGKIENPSLFDRALTDDERSALHAGSSDLPHPWHRWDFAADMARAEVPEVVGGAPPAQLRGGAERAVTSHAWDGSTDSFLVAPEQYAAVQFHADAMVDANWTYNLEFDVPEDLASGVYAVKLDAGGKEDHYPFFVRGRVPERADVLFLLPTNTYLAYANDRFASSDLTPVMGHEMQVSEDEKYLNEHPELGKSCYDVHGDGTPVRYSSRRRPLVNVRPHYPNFLNGTVRHFALDLFLVEWLERSPFSFHVATDEDLHAEGRELLDRYQVVVTGSHPEYWTGPALTALQSFLAESGKLMYLGGNGFYWITTVDPERPWIIEVRRDNSGLRAWDAPVGERGHAQTGEPGGLWRYRGRGPNTICGVAFATEGWSDGRGFVRTPATYDAPLSRFFAGIEEEVVGDFGYVLGGAAGDECDRFDLTLGSPPQTQVLASATGFGPEYLIVNEDVLIPMPGQDGPHRPENVRADMVYIPLSGGGEVFSASSIAFAGAIAWNDFDNNACRLVDNVLREFVANV
ncbi:N,N-dimethylformamidase beta subunit family domain-containing protein [Kribbella sp. CA-253562]|uniref:N,N-dimethylformamidase beta subunit family domain-containing protein n=1 Tax=Kribbella sp. CA-253562 TaxID=3239942 RepID=UPI003D8BC75C